MLLEKGVLKICRKFTGEHPCRSVISIKLLYMYSCKYAAYFQNQNNNNDNNNNNNNNNNSNNVDLILFYLQKN